MTHPGEMLSEYVNDLYPYMTQRDLARRLGVTPKHVCELFAGRARITIDLALKLELVLGRPAHFWTALQQRYDLAKARKKGENGNTKRRGG